MIIDSNNQTVTINNQIFTFEFISDILTLLEGDLNFDRSSGVLKISKIDRS